MSNDKMMIKTKKKCCVCNQKVVDGEDMCVFHLSLESDFQESWED